MPAAGRVDGEALLEAEGAVRVPLLHAGAVVGDAVGGHAGPAEASAAGGAEARGGGVAG